MSQESPNSQLKGRQEFFATDQGFCKVWPAITLYAVVSVMQTWNKHQYFSPKLPVKTVILSYESWSHIDHILLTSMYAWKRKKKTGSYSFFSNWM